MIPYIRCQLEDQSLKEFSSSAGGCDYHCMQTDWLQAALYNSVVTMCVCTYAGASSNNGHMTRFFLLTGFSVPKEQ